MRIQDGALIDEIPEEGLDEADRRILGIIQSDFPLASRPYAAIGAQLGLSEEEAFARIQALREKGIIRRIGANFQSAKLGFHSTLCAAKVPEDKLESFIARVNSEPGVTHNYLRDHVYNIWFTCIGESRAAVEGIVEAIRRESGVEVLNLPAARLYKIRVDFPLEAE